MMMEQSLIKEITDSLFHGEKRARSDNKNEQIKKKQRQGYQAVNTEKGATAITALHQTTKRDEHQNQLALKKTINGLNHEIKQVETVLTGLAARKTKNPQSYWTADESCSQADLCLFLRMFCPDCGLFTKQKNDQWRFVQEQLLQILSKAAVDAKEEEFSRHHAVLQEQLDEVRNLRVENDNEEQGQEPQDPEPTGKDHGNDNECS